MEPSIPHPASLEWIQSNPIVILCALFFGTGFREFDSCERNGNELGDVEGQEGKGNGLLQETLQYPPWCVSHASCPTKPLSSDACNLLQLDGAFDVTHNPPFRKVKKETPMILLRC